MGCEDPKLRIGFVFSCVSAFELGIQSPGTGESEGGMRGQHARGRRPDPLSAEGVCPGKRRRGCLSPDTVLLLVLQDPARAVIMLIYDQVSICVVARVKVGDHTGGDPQASHHCRKTKKKSPMGCGFRNPTDSLGPGEPFIWHLQDGSGAVCGYGLRMLPTSLPTFLSSSLGLMEETPGKGWASGCSDKQCQGQASCEFSCLQAAGDRHTPFGKTQWPDSVSLLSWL